MKLSMLTIWNDCLLFQQIENCKASMIIVENSSLLAYAALHYATRTLKEGTSCMKWQYD